MADTRAHAQLGASSAYRWFVCPGSVALSADIPRTSSIYADEGTAAHYLAETCLQKDIRPEEFYGRVIRVLDGGCSMLKMGASEDSGFLVSDEMIEAVDTYLSTIHADHVNFPAARRFIEQKFDISSILPAHLGVELFGTNDAGLAEDYGRLIVYDLKYGRGVKVEVENNPQLMYYALGAYLAGDFLDVEMVVVQPRAFHKDGPVRRWKIPVEELLQWKDETLIPAVRRVLEKPEFHAGGHCHFCPALSTCGAAKGFTENTIRSAFTDLTLPDSEGLTPEEMANILEAEDVVSSWFQAIRMRARAMLEVGDTVPGWKLVQKQTRRKWKNEGQVIAALKKYHELLKDVIKLKISAPSATLKAVSKLGIEMDLAPFITKDEGDTTIVRESDPRPAIVVNMGEEFKDLETEFDF